MKKSENTYDNDKKPIQDKLHPNDWLNLLNSENDKYYRLLDDIKSYFYSIEDCEFLTEQINFEFDRWIFTGCILHAIKHQKLYHQLGYKAFSSYCHKELNRSIWAINYLIASAYTTLELISYGFEIIPQCESQARLLSKFRGETLADKWHDVLTAIDNDPLKLNAKLIKKIVSEKLERPIALDYKIVGEVNGKYFDIPLSYNVVSKLITLSKSLNVSPDQLMSDVLNQLMPDQD
jgi:hypothetical protein